MFSFSFGIRISICSCSYFLQAVHTGTNLSLLKNKMKTKKLVTELMRVMLSYAPPQVSILGLLSYCAVELVPVPFINEAYVNISLQPGSE